MNTLKKTLFGGIVTIMLIAAGFIFLLRSCLSKYDERAMISKPLLFERNGKAIVFSLVKFDKTTSYQQNGGFTSKSVNTTFYLQTNDAVTGEKTGQEKLKDRSDITSFPIEIMGSSAGRAWIFAGEPMAFDPFDLKKMADIKMIEAQNPSLIGKLSKERKYYELENGDSLLYFTIKDGSRYKLNTITLSAVAVNENGIPKDPVKTKASLLDAALKDIEKASQANYQKYRDAMKPYNQRPSASKSYVDITLAFEKERKFLDKARDSIYALQREVGDERSNIQALESRLHSLQNFNSSFSSMKVNTDTFFHQWYGLLTATELEKLPKQFDHRSSYGDASRNQLFKAGIYLEDSSRKYSPWNINENKQPVGNSFYLEGGFLLDIKTGTPFHFTDGFLIVYKKEIGTDAAILISRIDTSGKQLWTMDTGLKQFSYWVRMGDRMIITGIDNKELSSGEDNVLYLLDLQTGHFFTYDFFTDKQRK